MIISGLFLGLVLWGPIAAVMARDRGRNALAWYFGGVVIGFIALIILGVQGKTDEKKAAELREVAAATAAAGPSSAGHVGELRELAELHDKGALTDEEYAHEKEHVFAQS
jgi:hypothetical protein